MDPSNKTNSGIELPSPGMEQGSPAAPAGSGEILPQAPEFLPTQAERAPVLGPPAVAPPLSSGSVSQPLSAVPPVAANDVAATTGGSGLTVDDDDDLIEKAWVEKAKQIVERTRDDPFRQSEALTVFKADYMKKRYGKTIKISQ